jgi:hypothetical protein
MSNRLETGDGAVGLAEILRRAFNANDSSNVMIGSSPRAAGVSEDRIVNQAGHAMARTSTPANETIDDANDVDVVEALVANPPANEITGSSTPVDMFTDELIDTNTVAGGHIGLDDQGRLVLTHPGTQTLTPQAQELTNMIIDHTQFPDGVSPLTKLHLPHTPQRLDAPLTPDELQRLMDVGSLTLSRPVTPERPTVEVIPQTHQQIDTDTDVDMIIGDADEDVFIAQDAHIIDVNENDVSQHRREGVAEDQQEEDQQEMDQQEDGTEQEAQGIQDDGAEEEMERITRGSSDAASSSPTTKTPLRQSRQPPSRQSRPSLPPLSPLSDDMESEDSDSDTESDVTPPPKPAKRAGATKSAPRSNHSNMDSTDQVSQVPEAIDMLLEANDSFKMSLEGTLKSAVRGPATLLKEPAVTMAEDPLKIKVFSLDPTADASDFEFRTHKNVVSDGF